MLALVGLALSWGWSHEAAIFMMSWSAPAFSSMQGRFGPGTSFALLRNVTHRAAESGKKHVELVLDMRRLG